MEDSTNLNNVPPPVLINPDLMQMPPPDNVPPPMMQAPPPDSMMTPPPTGFGPPGTQGWANDDFVNMGPPPSLMQQPPPVSDKQLPSLLSLKVDPPEQMMEGGSSEVVLPQALEEVLALKNQRAMELGTEIDENNEQSGQQKEPEKEPLWERDENVENTVVEAEADVNHQKEKEPRVSKNKRRRREERTS